MKKTKKRRRNGRKGGGEASSTRHHTMPLDKYITKPYVKPHEFMTYGPERLAGAARSKIKKTHLSAIYDEKTNTMQPYSNIVNSITPLVSKGYNNTTSMDGIGPSVTEHGVRSRVGGGGDSAGGKVKTRNRRRVARHARNSRGGKQH